MTVMSAIEERQARVQLLQAELDAARERLLAIEKGYEVHQKRMAHIDERLVEITGKLNGLIG